MVKFVRNLALKGEGDDTGRPRERREGPQPFPTFQEAIDLNTQAMFALRDKLELGNFNFALMAKSLSALKATFDQANKLQTATLTTNRTLNDVLGKNTAMLASMPGDIGLAVQSQFEFLEAGLVGAGEDSIRLATTMKSLGLSTQQLMATNLDAATFGRATPGELDSLNRTILDTTQKQGVSFNRLVGAVDSLSKNIRVLGFLGITTDVLKTQTKLIGEFGAGSEKIIQSMMSQLFDPQASVAQQSMLGIFDKIQALRAPGATVDERAAIFKDIAKTAEGTFGNIADSFRESGIPLEFLGDALEGFGGFGGLGNMAEEMAAFNANLTPLDRAMIDTTNKFDETIENFVAQVWKPLKITLMTTFTPIIKFLNNWGPLLGKIIAVLLPVWVTMKIGQKIAIMNQERLKSNTDAMWNLGNKLNKLALAQGYGAGEQGMPMKSGLFALFGGPWGAAITLGIGLISQL